MSPRDGLGTDNAGLDGAEGTALADLAEAERRGRPPDLASLKAVTTVTWDFTSQNIQIAIFVKLGIYIYINIYTYMYVYIYICIHTYIMRFHPSETGDRNWGPSTIGFFIGDSMGMQTGEPGEFIMMSP